MSEQNQSSSIGDMSRSIENLCNQLPLINLSIPRIEQTADVLDFIREFESATVTLSNEQIVKMLSKSFPSGKHLVWYKNMLTKLESEGLALNWPNIKKQIMCRYSNIDERDRQFKHLSTLKFVDKSGNKFYDFVEDMLFPFNQALAPNFSSPFSSSQSIFSFIGAISHRARRKFSFSHELERQCSTLLVRYSGCTQIPIIYSREGRSSDDGAVRV